MAKVWWQGHETTGHIIPTVRKRRGMNTGTQFPFLLSWDLRDVTITSGESFQYNFAGYVLKDSPELFT